MEIEFKCDKCGQLITAPEDMIGRAIICPDLACGCSLTVPSGSSVPSEAPLPTHDITFDCPNCRHELVVDKAGAGMELDCPHCGKIIIVPNPAPPAAPAQPASAAPTWTPPPPPPAPRPADPLQAVAAEPSLMPVAPTALRIPPPPPPRSSSEPDRMPDVPPPPMEKRDMAQHRTLGWVLLVLWLVLSFGPATLNIKNHPERVAHLEISEIPGARGKSNFYSNSKLEVSSKPGNPGVLFYDGLHESVLVDDDLSKMSNGAEYTGRIVNNDWGIGAVHTIKGTVEINHWTFKSDSKEPLVFCVKATQGYVYQTGRGTVTNPRGHVVELGFTGATGNNMRWVLLCSLPFIFSPLLILAVRSLSRPVNAWFDQRKTLPVAGPVLTAMDSVSGAIDNWLDQHKTHSIVNSVLSSVDSLSRSLAAWFKQFKMPSLDGVARSVLDSLTVADPLKPPGNAMIIEEKNFREAVQNVVKGAITIGALVILQLVTGWLFDITRTHWIEIVLSLVIVGFAIKLYHSVKTLAIFYLTAWFKMRKMSDHDKYLGNLVAATGNLTLFVFGASLYLYLLPVILHFRSVATILNVLVLLAAGGLLFILWKNAQPLIDMLSVRITDKVSELSSSIAYTDCPACKARNDRAAAFCVSCGSPMEQAPPTPPAEAPPVNKGRCPQCAADNPPTAKFCHQCGSSL